ncbi:CD59 glycoprotein-like [Stegostoma tigrinum]|uniref:CD59 glycoprotein-like n=1 Tax=Stegostoma tigrinum TaxID=3053191 RepID=UPI00202B3FD1|nr:CD59 glycoprotein-like [Stegostoma tigrinum]XP_048401019.1 CD59 glycoprotein-like [Stegostoma tigrinum]XP_048401020.1 CD59 glycoprotein-like [Stegostoma tigrinum]XP_048401021.1 CD59 glycoprotein-like [Stegostoma tigrinum]XP_048401023.1 CD59 glycoprotein-like [Stegostoma tigrinum]XP_048401024.1 CD59 glycoprotein-like [Stegostoma tigrinum]XP_059507912.1 CD59 glycoprotein-like [Stegostoma tigrinum]XP_059507913.1 CD59 glycoprotein-like [Stegostoma tigrinum]XP_059507914.1 CD59 glycoprotein-li
MAHVLVKSFLLLSVFSLGSAIICYICDSDDDLSCSKQNCPSHFDTCLNVTRVPRKFLRRCWTDRECHVKAVKAEYSRDSDFSFTCCNWDLCNSRSGSSRVDRNLGLLAVLAPLAGWHLSRF